MVEKIETYNAGEISLVSTKTIPAKLCQKPNIAF